MQQPMGREHDTCLETRSASPKCHQTYHPSVTDKRQSTPAVRNQMQLTPHPHTVHLTSTPCSLTLHTAASHLTLHTSQHLMSHSACLLHQPLTCTEQPVAMASRSAIIPTALSTWLGCSRTITLHPEISVEGDEGEGAVGEGDGAG